MSSPWGFSWSFVGARLRFVGVASALFLVGCQHTAPHVHSTFEVVEPDAGGPQPKAPSRHGHGPAESPEATIPVEILGDKMPQPVLPSDAIEALGGRRSMEVQVSIDATGHVTDVAPALVGFLLPDAVAREILDAIRAAVAQWQIRPARLIHYQRNARGDRQYVSSEPVPSVVQLKFTFAVSNEHR